MPDFDVPLLPTMFSDPYPFLPYCFAPFKKELQHDGLLYRIKALFAIRNLSFLSFINANAKNYGYYLGNIAFVNVFFKQFFLYLWSVFMVCFRSTKYKEHFRQSYCEVLLCLCEKILQLLLRIG